MMKKVQDHQSKPRLGKAVAMVGLMGVLLTSVSCGTDPAPPLPPDPPPATATGSIVLGDISNDPVKKIGRYQPLADYLAANLGEFDIGVGEVVIAPDIETMAQKMQSGEVDIFFDSLYPTMIVSEQSGSEPILRRWKKGQAEYHTIFFARADSGLKSLADLQGKVIGVETPRSTTGYFIPIVYLLEAGLKPVEKIQETDTIATGEVGYIFTEEDENTIQWVGSSKVAAGAIDNHSFAKIPPESRAELVILAETESLARHVAVISAGIEPPLRSAITQQLLELDKTEDGRKVLEAFEATTKFDQLPPEAGWARMQELYQIFQSR